MKRPANLSFRLTWDLAAEASKRHAPDIQATWISADVVCACCGQCWPCGPRQNADDTMRLMEDADSRAVADFLPGADYAIAAQDRHVPARQFAEAGTARHAAP